MTVFIRYLILLTYISVNQCFSIIIIDIETHHKNITAYDQTQLPVAVPNSLKIVTFDTDAQKITRVDFLAFNPRSIEYNYFSLGFLNIGFTSDHMADFTVTPDDGFKGIIRRNGAFTCNLTTGNLQATSLSHLDETRPMLMGVFISPYTHTPFDDFAAALNRHDILEQCKQRKIKEINQEIASLDQKDAPHQATILKSKSHTQKYKNSLEQITKNATNRAEKLKRISDIQSGVEKTIRTGITPANLYAYTYWDARAQKTPAYTLVTDIPNSDELCELACDLTMMAQRFTKIDGKYGGNKGFDGLYMKDGIIIAAESKFHKTPPTLHTVISKEIKSKFDFAHSGAIKHISERSVSKIKEAYDVKTIYMLAYAMLSDGQVDCRLEHLTGEIDFPQSQELATPIKTGVEVKAENSAQPSLSTTAAIAETQQPTLKVEVVDIDTSGETKESDQIGLQTPHTKIIDYSTLTPQSDPADIQKAFDDMLSSFKEKTGLSPEQLINIVSRSNILNIVAPVPFSLESAIV